MFNEYKWNDPMQNPNYCGYCKSEPCQCDGHGNFGGEQDGLDLIETVEEEVVDEEEEEGELTYEDGSPYDPDAGKRDRSPAPPRQGSSYRPQRPSYMR
jgi:hypothetical protein